MLCCYFSNIQIYRSKETSSFLQGNMMFEKWPLLAPKVIDLVRQTVKDKNVLKLLSLADGDIVISVYSASDNFFFC